MILDNEQCKTIKMTEVVRSKMVLYSIKCISALLYGSLQSMETKYAPK